MASANHLDAWTIDASHYPRSGTPREQLMCCVRYAILAPSSHNTQPWFFGVDNGAIELYADRSRQLEVIDPHDRQLLMSCGAALFNLRLAIRRFGHAPRVELLPSATEPDLLARIAPHGSVGADAELADSFDAIVRRHTNRNPFDMRPVGYRLADALIEAAAAEGAWLVRLHPERKELAAKLIAAADETQFHDAAFRKELSHWLVPNTSARGDGIPGYSKSYGSPLSAGNTLLVRTFDIGGKVASTEYELAAGSPVLGVLGTDRDGPADWLRAGQAMQRVLLRATTFGLSASFLNQVLELPTFRRSFASLSERPCPQLVLRIGYAPPAAATPRRPVDAVVRAPAADALGA